MEKLRNEFQDIKNEPFMSVDEFMDKLLSEGAVIVSPADTVYKKYSGLMGQRRKMFGESQK